MLQGYIPQRRRVPPFLSAAWKGRAGRKVRILPIPSHATLGSWLSVVLCSKAGVWPLGPMPFMVNVPLAFGELGGQRCGGCLPAWHH